MKVTETSLPGVLLVEPSVFRDHRGAFSETWNRRAFAEAGIADDWVQDNFSVSVRNVIRGIHYQIIQPQAKLVRVTHGAAWDVAVDLRRSSPHFGRHVGVDLSADNGRMLYIPVGFGHGFAALSAEVGFAYKITDYRYPAGERTMLWNDPELAIPWPVSAEEAIVSEKDGHGKGFREAEVFN